MGTTTEHSGLRVLIVDDSALYRQSIGRALQDVSWVEVVGIAKDGVEAIEKIQELAPDVITLDVEMPEMNGIETLREIQRRRLRVGSIMVSSLTAAGAKVTMDALMEGAFDFIQKPSGGLISTREQLRNELTEKLCAYRQHRNSRQTQTTSATASQQSRSPIARPSQTSVTDGSTNGIGFCDLVLIGLSTGGPQALRHVLPKFDTDFPVPIVIVQHMPPTYTKTMAERLDEVINLSMREAVDGDVPTAGTILLAPGGSHLQLHRSGNRVSVRLTDDPPENSCRPAVDYTLRSATQAYDGRLLSVIMTGMGRDGMVGCQELKAAGGVVYAQDEASSAVYGMPKAVIEIGVVDRVLPLAKIAPAVVRHAHRTQRSQNRTR